MRIRSVVALVLVGAAAGWLVYHLGSNPPGRRGAPERESSGPPEPLSADPPPVRPGPSAETEAVTCRPEEAVESAEERERKAMEAALAQKVPPVEAVPKLVEALRGPDPKRRATAVRLLKAIGAEAAPAVPALIEALRDEGLRHPAARALAAMGRAAHEALWALEACLDSPDGAFRVAAARAIWEITGVTGPTVAILCKVLDEGPEFSPQFAAYSLGDMGSEGVAGVPALVRRLQKETTRMEDRTQIYFGLGRIGTGAAEALPHARADLDAEDLKLRSAAAYAVFRISGDVTSTLPILIEAIEEGDRHVSTWAAGNIGDLGALAAPAVPALRKARDEGIPRIKGPAAMSLYRITGEPEEALPLFIEEVKQLGWYASVYAGQLGEIGRDALPAVPALEAAAVSGNYDLQREAKKALEKIRGR